MCNVERRIIMKALRYLLIVMGLMSVLSISAQALAQQPQAQMQSTSIIAGSGSQLPSAAVQGTYVTGTAVGTYTPANATNGPAKMRRDVGGGGSTADDEDPDGPGEPFPLGDAGWPLMMLAAAYALLRLWRKRRV